MRTIGISLHKRRPIYLRDLLYELVIRDLKLRYKRSFLGIGWSLLNPIAQLIVFGFVFGVILPAQIPNFLSFLYIGVLAWSFFQTSLLQATDAIMNNGPLIRHPGFPALLLPIVTVTSELVHFLLALPILFLFLFFEGVPLTITVIALPLVIALQLLFNLSLAYWVATLQVIFHDTRYLLGIILMFGVFLSGIFYDISFVSAQYKWVFYLNPIVHLLDAYRSILLHSRFPSGFSLLLLAFLSFSLLWLGIKYFRWTSYRFVEEI